MLKIAQIVDNKLYWLFNCYEIPVFSDDIKLIDVTDVDDIEEGWDYNSETGEFTAPVYEEMEPVIQIDEIQAKILVNTETLISMKEMGV